MESIFDTHASSEYIFKVDDFEGPIELLYQLVKSNGLDILTFKLSQITDQYLAIIDTIDRKNLDATSDFLLVAATLLEIKARELLPREEEEEMLDEDYIDPADALILKIQEYAIYQEKAKIMKEQETLNRFYREPTYSEKDARVSIVGFNLDKLMQAYAKVLFEFTKEEEFVDVKQIARDEYTVEHQLKFLVDELLEKKEVSFFDLFREAHTKSEVINTFLALLQLVSKQFAKMKQETQLGDIIIGINDDCDPETYDYNLLALAGKEDNFDGQSNTNP